MYRVLLFLIISLVLNACSGSISPDEKFTSLDSSGIIVFAVDSGSSRGYDIFFRAYDKQSKKLHFAVTGGKTKTFYQSTPRQFHVGRIPPGTYVLASLQQSMAGNRNYISCLNKGSFMFDIAPGEVKYLGDFEMFKNNETAKVRYLGRDLAGASRALRKRYPNVSVKPKLAKLTQVSFRPGTDIFGIGKSCGGYYYN